MPDLPAADYLAQLPRKRMAAAVLFMNADDRILLCEPTYKDYWEIPGGAVDADESPRDAAKREVWEELGLSVAPGRLLVVDWVPPRNGRTEGLIIVFDGGRLQDRETEDIRLPPDELRSWAWCSEPQAIERLSPLLARRALAARSASLDGVTRYLEDGRPLDRSAPAHEPCTVSRR